jgi:hypothetical protein
MTASSYVSHYGDVFALTSRNDVGRFFADFSFKNWIPLVLVRDNIGENIGGSLIEELRVTSRVLSSVQNGLSRITRKGT